jgi:hypothetical protein
MPREEERRHRRDDERLTERRDEAVVNGTEGTQENGCLRAVPGIGALHQRLRRTFDRRAACRRPSPCGDPRTGLRTARLTQGDYFLDDGPIIRNRKREATST